MRALGHGLFFAALILSALFLSPAAARAQTAVSYRFLEVLDADGKPVADATVEAVGTGGAEAKRTDARGAVRDMPVYYGDHNTRGFKVSKPGYLTYEVDDLYERGLYREMFESVIPQFDEKSPIKVVLLKLPVTPAERAPFEKERRRREFLSAVRAGDVVTARKLLRGGVSPDATDVNGIPAILWASAYGHGGMIKTLLDAGADVRNKSGPGYKALLHYLSYAKPESVAGETVRSLIAAGADVNAADRYGATVLSLARRSGNAEVIKSLERAGAR